MRSMPYRSDICPFIYTHLYNTAKMTLKRRAPSFFFHLNSEAEYLELPRKQRRAGFPACRFAGLSSPASRQLKARSNWQTGMLCPKRAQSARSIWVERARGTAVPLRTLLAGRERHSIPHSSRPHGTNEAPKIQKCINSRGRHECLRCRVR